MLRGYKKYVAESRSVVYISAILAFVIRWVYLGISNNRELDSYTESFLWKYISPLFSNVYISSITAFVVSIGLALYMMWLNDKYAIIRVRTSLPFAFFVFFTACFPSLFEMNPFYISVFFVLLSIDILYGSYQKENVAEQSFRIAFLLALGSLFSFNLLFYVPVFWIGSAIVRSFKFKVILSSLLGLVMVYWIVGFIVYFMELSNPLTFYIDKWRNYSLPSFSYQLLSKWGFLGINALIATSVIIYYYANSYKDKIQIRTYVSFLIVLFYFSLLLSVVLLPCTDVSFMVMLVTLSFIFAHYFALIEQKGNIYFFITVILFYLMMYLYEFSNLV